MSDVAFEKFRAKLADKVTCAINSQHPIKCDGGLCPIGATNPAFLPSSPTPERALRDDYPEEIRNVGHFNLNAFMRGFDGRGGSGPYFDLGLLYRERFLK